MSTNISNLLEGLRNWSQKLNVVEVELNVVKMLLVIRKTEPNRLRITVAEMT